VNNIPTSNGTSNITPTSLSSYQPSKLGINTNQFGMKPLHVNTKAPAPPPPNHKDEADSVEEDLVRYSEHQTNGLLY
jgi:hypothetical protein